ncbi:MAG: amphi-Trp domain-containing protein [Halobacteriota archaeon]
MPEEVLFKTEGAQPRSEIASVLTGAAEEIEAGSVTLGDGDTTETVTIPEEATFEVELERVTDSETGEGYYELEYELQWTV